MIVVCTACTAKFKVADEKVGPRGAKLRCSKCGTVFTVRREEPPPSGGAEAAFDPGVAPAAPEPPPAPAAPPPLPRRSAAPPASPDLGAPVDARSAFEIDLEPPPPLPRPAAERDPFAAPLPDDPFAPPAAAPGPSPEAPPPPGDPFGGGLSGDDPFAAVQAPVPPELLQAPPAPPAPALPPDDPFAAALPPLAAVGAGGDLALEERTIPPPRATPQSSAPLDDPFGAAEAPGDLAFDDGRPGDIPPMVADLPGEPFGGFAQGSPSLEEPPAAPRREAPLRVDPFAAAAVDADPIEVAPPPGRAAGASAPSGPAASGPPPAAEAGAEAEPTEAAGTRPLARLRGAAVNAVSLLALLLVAVALLVVWRGNLPLSEAFHPSRLLAALTHRDRVAPPFQPHGVTSGLYERASGAPLLFVRGEIRSNAAAPVAAVKVAVELVRDGAVVARGEAVAGGLPTPEELFEAGDAAALARVAEAAAARAAGPVAPGGSVPFLVALAEYPGDLGGVALRVRAEGAAR